jgi:hypothetical protein
MAGRGVAKASCIGVINLKTLGPRFARLGQALTHYPQL